MAQETINSIREAESRATQAIKDAQDKAADMISQAESEGKAYEQSLLSDVKVQAAKRKEEALLGKEEALEASRRRAMAVMAQNKERMESRIPQAIDLVISELV